MKIARMRRLPLASDGLQSEHLHGPATARMALVVMLVIVSVCGAVQPAQAADGVTSAAATLAAAPPPIPPLGPVDPGPDGSVQVDRAALELNPPVAPSALTLPLRPGQELVDGASAESLETLAAAGFVGPGGVPAIDAAKLQPQVAAGRSGLLSYRVCSQSATKAASCTGLLLQLLPARVDVTGDGTADVTAQLRPTLTGGLSFLVRRLSTSETTGSLLKAHVWALYDLSNSKRLSVGFDGFRRGSNLPQETSGVFTFDRTLANQGVFDVGGALTQSGAGSALAVTMGLASLASGAAGQPIDPTVASARFSPVPGAFRSHAVVDLGANRTSIDATTNGSTLLDAVVIANRRPGGTSFDKFTQLRAELPAATVSAGVTRLAGSASLQYQSSAPVVDVFLADYEYVGLALDRSIRARGQAVPASFTASLTSDDDVTIDYDASGPMSALDAGFYDRRAATVSDLSLQGLPTSVDLRADPAGNHLRFAGNQSLGRGTVALSHGGGSFSRLDGEHATLVVAGQAFGASLNVTGMRSIDTSFGPHPRLSAIVEPGGQPFVAAGESGVQRSRVEVSNLPPSLSLDLDPVARTIGYDATAGVPQTKAAFTNTGTGPTVVATVFGLPTSLDLAYDVGQRPRVASVATSPFSRLELFASDAPVATLQADTHHYLSLAADDVPTAAEISVDFAARHLEGTLSAVAGHVFAVARSDVGGRDFAVTADLRGVPSGFDADFADGTYRVRGLTGPFASATVAVTNHPGTQRPLGEHLAVQYRQLTGDFDASVSLGNLSHVEYSRGTLSQQFRLEADAPVAWLDADVVLAAGGVDDTQLAVTARIDRLPNTVNIGLTSAALTYSTEQPTSLLAETRLGKVAALVGVGAPLFDQGVAVHAAGCAAGPGCADDASVLCTLFGRCFGVVGTVHLPVLGTLVSADLAARTVTINGEPQSGLLNVYVQLDGLIGRIDRLRALATLGGLPSSLDLTIGPFGFDTGDPSRLHVESRSASGAIGVIQVNADADTMTNFGNVRGQMTATSPAAVLDVTGQFGSASHIDVINSSAMDELSVQVTGLLLSGNPASGRVSFTDIPAVVDFDITGFGASALGVPTIRYDGHGASTLDGLVLVEADLIEAFAIDGVTIPQARDAWARLTNLGTDTTVSINADTSVLMSSVPDTDAIELGASLESSVDPLVFDNLEVCNEAINIPGPIDAHFVCTLDGHVGVPTIHIGDLALSINGLRSLALRPGEAAYLSMGIDGDYDLLSIDPADVFIDPDIDLTLTVEQVAGPDFTVAELPFRIDDPFTGVRFHLADNVLRTSGQFELESAGIGVACLTVKALPGPIRTGVNSIEIFGADGRQTLNYIDPIPLPGDVDPAIASMHIDLLTAYFTHPFPEHDAQFDIDLGGC